MDPPPPHNSSSAAATSSFVGGHSSSSSSPRGRSMSSAALMMGAHHSQSQQRRSSLYPPPMPNRQLASRNAAASCTGGSSSRPRSRYSGRDGKSQTASLYDELCAIRSTSALFMSRIDSIVDDQRKRHTQQPQQKQKQILLPYRHQPASSSHRYGPSSSSSQQHQHARPWKATNANLVPSWPRQRQQHQARPYSSSMSGRLDLTPNGNISVGSFSTGIFSSSAYASSPSLSQHNLQHAWPSSTTSGLPRIPAASSFSFSSNASSPSLSQNQQQLRQHARSPSTTTGTPDHLPFFGSYTPSLFPPQQHPLPASLSSTNTTPSLFPPQQHPLPASLSSTNTIPSLLPGRFSASTTSGLTHMPGGSFFACTPSLPPQLQDQRHMSSSTVSGFAAFAQASQPSLASHYQQHQPWNSGQTRTTLLPGPSSCWSSPSSSDNNAVPSSWTAWSNTSTSGSGNNGFVEHPSSAVSTPSEQHDDELPPLPPSLQQTPPPLLLPVKQEPVMDMDSSSSVHLDPELIYIDNDDEPVDLDTLLASLEASPALMASLLESNPGLESTPLLDPASFGDMQFQMGGANGDNLMMMSSPWGGTETGAQTWSPSLVPEDVVNAFGMMSIDSSAASLFGGMDWTGQMSSMPSLQQQVPWQQGGTTLASSSSGLSSPHSWQPSSQSDRPQQFMQTTPAGFELPPLPPSMDMGILPVTNSTSSATHMLQYGNSIRPTTSNAGNDQNWGVTQGAASNCDVISGSNNSNMPWQGHSSSTGSSSIAMPKLRLGGMESQRVPPPTSPSLSSSTGAASSMSRSGGNGNLFTDAEMEIVIKDKRLKELVNNDPNRVKRILRNRASASKAKAKKKNSIRDLEQQFEALQAENSMLSSQVFSEQAKKFELQNQNNGLGKRLQQLEAQAKMGQVQSEALRAEIESLKLAELTGLHSNDVHTPTSSGMEPEVSWHTDS